MAFLEKIGKHISDVGQNVTQQTKNLADVAKLNNAIREKTDKISRLYMIIGKEYYENHMTDMLAEAKQKIDEINTLHLEIQRLQEEIKQIKGVGKCTNCGADVPVQALFCSSCGAKVEKTKVVENIEEKRKVCPTCGTILNEENLFCVNCGTKIEEVQEEEGE